MLQRDKVECVLIEVTPRPVDAAPWKEALWIEPGRAVVRKSVVGWRPTAATMESVQTTIWEKVDFGKPLPPNTFEFAPPPKSGKVEAFRAPGRTQKKSGPREGRSFFAPL